ncbi:hypothetical protein H2200_004916 [Cladophialophora chaetospira]|uniref:Serine aminopeptidase S33 domain-containing protein n=1 Tax=Cladophialophora chaetospira TaxID=386627 RepID=A0AA39CJW9_9EURO|nr:hypothetical protein H2200_004916 [Cladophialophora chaetospira]
MPYITSAHDGARLFYRDYIPASSPSAFMPQPQSEGESDYTKKPVLVFTAAWPFSSAMWDHLLVPLVEIYRCRCIAPDRRGYGRSEWNGPDASKAAMINYDTFASDLVQILDAAKVSEGATSPGFIGIGASMGGGELLMALSASTKLRDSCKGLIFIGSSLPIPLRTKDKPNGPLREFWDRVLSDIRQDKMGWFKTGLPFVFGPDKLSQTEVTRYERMVEESDPIAVERTVQAFLERDLTELMRSLHDPEKPLSVLILQGDKDSVNPIDEGPELVKRCLPDTKIVVYDDAYHGERTQIPETLWGRGSLGD